jgi:hypothetical protein
LVDPQKAEIDLWVLSLENSRRREGNGNQLCLAEYRTAWVEPVGVEGADVIRSSCTAAED